MENNIENLEKHIAFLNGKTTPKESKEIEDQITADQKNISEFEETKLLKAHIKEYYLLKEAEEALKMPKKQIKLNWLKIAVAASVLLFSSSIYLYYNKNYFPDLVFEIDNLRGETRNLPLNSSPQELAYNLFLQGKANYYSHEYKAAIVNFKKALDTPNLRNQIVEAIKWHLCVSYLLDNQPIEAETIFNELNKIENPKYSISPINKAKIRFQIKLKKLF